MNQILHIFKKDLRRHYPEILISLALLALFTRNQLHIWQKFADGYTYTASPYFLFFAYFSTRIITPALVLAWFFLILRVVHSDPLVGDRQWWITKPYEWGKLLLAKLLFIFVFISVPLFHTQLFLLHRAGFPVLANLLKLGLMQFTLPFVLILFAFALAALTKNIAQAFLGIGIAIIALILGLWLDSFSSHMMGDSSKVLDTLETFLPFAALILVPIWQFARRRTWASRSVLFASCGAAFLLSLVPTHSRVEQTYSLVSTSDAPVQLTVPAISESSEKRADGPFSSTDVSLSIPINASGIAPGTAIIIAGMKLTADSPGDSSWTHGWDVQYRQLWPGDQRADLSYQIKRKQYESLKSKPLNLHIELALSEYGETDARTLILPSTTFRDTELGLCRLSSLAPSAFQCLKPFRVPTYMARFDAPHSSCRAPANYPSETPPNLDVAYSWMTSSDDLIPDPGLNPVVDYAISFNPVTHIPGPDATTRPAFSVPFLCPGAEIRIAHPTRKRQFRIQLNLPHTRLQDLAQPAPSGLVISAAGPSSM